MNATFNFFGFEVERRPRKSLKCRVSTVVVQRFCNSRAHLDRRPFRSTFMGRFWAFCGPKLNAIHCDEIQAQSRHTGLQLAPERDESTMPQLAPNVMRRAGSPSYWFRFQVGGKEYRTSLRTTNLDDAAAMAKVLKRRAQMEQFGKTVAGSGDVVYFVHDLDLRMVKVGVTGKLRTRFVNLKTSTASDVRLLGAVPGGPDLEKVLHRFLAPFHHRREWFRAEPAVLDFVRSLIALGAQT